MTSRAAPPEAGTDARSAALRARLVPPMPGSRFWGWAGPLLVTALGTFLRFSRLGVPHAVVFDETYYVPDAYGILRYGAEHNYVTSISARNALLARGDPRIFIRGGEFVVHPPFGKVLIAAGERLFGLTPFGWRFAAAVAGSLSILMIARIARRMTRSTLLGCVAGLLLALDGLEFVMSRTALLDIFVMFWALAAFGCLVADRDSYRARLAGAAPPHAGALAPPRPGIRWWRVAAGVCLGLACASKWNGVWFIPAFGAMCIAWDIGARRAAGFHGAPGAALARDLGGLAGSFAAVPLLAYLATWSGWLATSSGYDRQWAAQHGMNVPVVSDLVSLFHYHLTMLHFSTTLTASHPYRSKPWTWLVLSRPVSYYWHCTPVVRGSCTGNVREVLAIGTPAIWWASILALLVCFGWWLARRDWRAGAVLVGVAAGWLPWFALAYRTQFYFYAVAFVPFLVLAITLCLGLVIGRARAGATRRAVGASLAGAYLLAVLLDFAYLYPVLAARVIPYAAWLSRMWYHPGGHGWI
jgi:dolichyl-phosphate-mannose--protein O-mannosyl transferase